MAGNAQFDLVIVGGGMVGASLLCALSPLVSRYGLRVAIIEAFPLYAQASAGNSGGQAKRSYQPSYDARSTALSWGSRNIFKRMGLWEKLVEQATPIERIHVSDRGHFGSVRMNAQDYSVDALGYVVENGWLGQVLLETVEQMKQVKLICPAQVARVESIPTGTRISFEQEGSSQSIEAGLLVIADGGRSELCQQLKVESEQHDYLQHAIIANVTVQKAHQNVAYERFTSAGPLALLPLHEPGKRASEQNRSALVLSVGADEVDVLMAMDNKAFIEQLQEKFGYRLGRFEQVGERHSYPLTLRRATDQIRNGIVVMGNAAHTLHPVAGQGFNLALRGVAALAETIREACTQNEWLGSIDVLQRYLARCDSDQQQTIAFSDQMIKLFSNDDFLLSHLRDLGLVALDCAPLAKKLFAHKAMGFSHQVPPTFHAGK